MAEGRSARKTQSPFTQPCSSKQEILKGLRTKGNRRTASQGFAAESVGCHSHLTRPLFTLR